jgi:peptidoglycan/xylan/chitin deacetylase (PgdA/CDA1 family)
MREALRSVFLRGLSFARLERLLLRVAALRRSTLVLNLHRVSDDANGFYPPMPPAVFEDLVRFLAKRATLRGIHEPPRHLAGKPDVVLSFDDGYKDFAEHAVPILKRHGVRANQNIVPTCVDEGVPPYTVLLTDFLQAAPASLLREIDIPGLPPPSAKVPFANALSRAIKLRSRASRQPMWDRLKEIMAKVDFRPTPMLTRAELRALDHDIGCHSFVHDSMEYETDAFFADDFARCEAWFQEALGARIDTYAFPNGSYAAPQIEHLRSRGVKHILLVGERAKSGDGDVTPRITTAGTTRAEARLLGAGLNAFR